MQIVFCRYIGNTYHNALNPLLQKVTLSKIQNWIKAQEQFYTTSSITSPFVLLKKGRGIDEAPSVRGESGKILVVFPIVCGCVVLLARALSKSSLR